jgi:hypothetical protein
MDVVKNNEIDLMEVIVQIIFGKRCHNENLFNFDHSRRSFYIRIGQFQFLTTLIRLKSFICDSVNVIMI